MKNYINYVNDHSGSMGSLRTAALSDFNANIQAVKNAASREELDTVVSVAEVGYVTEILPVVVSNPHVLKPKTNWVASGGTPLWGTIIALLDMLTKLPDAGRPEVSFLVQITTDGEATDRHVHQQLATMMQPLLATGRWTFVARVPKGIDATYRQQLLALGIPAGNIQEWETTAAGMAAATQVQTAAVDNYFRGRTAGATSSTSFYADSSNVNVSALNEIPAKEFSLYQVDPADNGIEIRPFVLKHRMEHLYGAAFYQLTKSEGKVQHDKQILVREPQTGKVYHGKEARTMIGLPEGRNARLHPSNLTKYEVFIQSNSINRKLVGGSGLIYWPKAPGARQFTDADTSYLKPKTVTATQSPVLQLPPVPVTNKPTKSPIPVTKKAPAGQYFKTREEARRFADSIGVAQKDIQDNGKLVLKERRWFVPGK